jgi:cell wall assembly regulator SMI1
METTTQETIARIDAWLAARRPDYYAQLQGGVLDAALDAFEARFELKLPAAFREFYKWRNGQAAQCSASLQDNRMFSTLEDIAESKDMLDGMIETDFDDPRWWRRAWVPFLNNGGGDHLCLDLAAEDGGTPGQLIAFWHDSARRPVVSPSFDAWLLKLAGSMEDGSIRFV